MEKETAFTTIGIVRSIFKNKFGVPRQPGLVPEVPATIDLIPPFNTEQVVRGLDGFSHIWILFIFHQSVEDGWNNTVRPPRLGGKKRVGVFASRSPFRPNNIGMSAVALEGISYDKGKVRLNVKGADIVDGTPVIDIKPYLPYSDVIEGASSGYAPHAPLKKFQVIFSDEASERLSQEEGKQGFKLREIVSNILSQDPRPGFYSSKYYKANFAITLNNLNINWKVEDDKIIVTHVTHVIDVV